MNAIDLLVTQHRELENLFEALLETAEERRQPLFDQAADLLISHVLIEEELFYPAVRAKRTEDVLLESLEEHLSLKRLVADLTALAPADQSFEPKVHVLEEQAEHHHQEEENHLFPKSRKLLSPQELEELGARMEARQKQLLAGDPRNRAATQTSEAAPLKG